METEAKRIYLDTNILAYVTNIKAPQHQVVLEIFRPTDMSLRTERSGVKQSVSSRYSWRLLPSGHNDKCLSRFDIRLLQ